MPPKTKVETSPHFEEIVNLLLQGKSGRKISAYLKNEYNEDIGFNAINNYRKKHIKLEDIVIQEVDNRLQEKEKAKNQEKEKAENQKKYVEEVSEKKAIEQVDTAERITQAKTNVVNKTADQVQGLLEVAENFPEDYKLLKIKAADPDSKVTQKDVANMSMNANKLYLDFIKKQDNNIEVNIENNTDLSKAFDENKMRNILDAKRGRNRRDTE